MEPTIYKPGAYNTPGIYKGAGGIYKGRGVYNDGAGGGGENVIGGREYVVVNMPDGHTWLAENLDYKFDGCVIGSAIKDSTPRGLYYNNDESTYGIDGNRYGLLYNWAAVNYLNINRETLCPGWHPPSRQELTDLITAVGANPGTKLKSNTQWNGTNDYGFSLPPAGQWFASFSSVGSMAYIWTSTPYSTNGAYRRNFGTDSTGASESSPNKQNYFCTVRLIKDY